MAHGCSIRCQLTRLVFSIIVASTAHGCREPTVKPAKKAAATPMPVPMPMPSTAPLQLTTTVAPARSGHDPSRNAIELIMPQGAFTTPMVELKWTALEDAKAYQVEVDDSEDCTSPLQTFATDHPHVTTGYLANGVYDVCVTARNGFGDLLDRRRGSFWVLAPKELYASPRRQNGAGATGASLPVSGLVEGDHLLSTLRDSYDEPLKGTAVPPPLPQISAGVFADPSDGARLKLLVADGPRSRIRLQTLQVSGRLAEPVTYDLSPWLAKAAGDRHGGPGPLAAALCPSGALIVTDAAHGTVLIWQRLPKPEFDLPAPDLILGGADALGGGLALKQPTGGSCLRGAAGTERLLVIDRGHHRLLLWSKRPETEATAPDIVIGQRDLTGTSPACTARGLSFPSAATLVGTKLFVADTGNHRIVAYGDDGWLQNPTALLAVGAPDLTHCTGTAGEAQSAPLLHAPMGLAVTGDRLATRDGSTGQIQIFNLDGPMPRLERVASGRGEDKVEAGTATLPFIWAGANLWTFSPNRDTLSVLPAP